MRLWRKGIHWQEFKLILTMWKKVDLQKIIGTQERCLASTNPLLSWGRLAAKQEPVKKELFPDTTTTQRFT